MRGLLRRVGLTEGQGYTVAILVVVALLLSTSLTRLHGRAAELISAPGPTVTTTTVSSPSTPPTTPSALPPVTTRPSGTGSAGPRDGTPPTTAVPAGSPATTATTLGPGDGAEPDVPCPTEDLVQGARALLEQLDVLLGGVVPTATVVSTLAIVTGCSQTDPLVLVLAALVEIGESLPDLGLGFFEFPVLPFLSLPDALIDLLQPLRPAIDPLCETVGTVGLLFSQVGPSYPYPLDATFAVSLFYLQATCGQIQMLGR